MAPPATLSYPRSRPSLPVLPHVPVYITPVQEDLIPQALRTRTSTAHLSTLQRGLGSHGFEGDTPSLHRSTTAPTQPSSKRPKSKNEEPEPAPLYTCTLCYRHLPPDTKPYILPRTHNESTYRKRDPKEAKGTGRILCRDCWIWIYSVSVCWTCGEVVGRKEERVGFGWCWWHWGCMGCLICKAPMKPPNWTGDQNGIELQDPPVCMACIVDAEVDSEIAKESSKLSEEKITDQMVDLRTTASELLHQMRRATGFDEPTDSAKDKHMHFTPKQSIPGPKLDTVLEDPQKEKNLCDGVATTVEITSKNTPDAGKVSYAELPKPPFKRPTHVSISHPLEPSVSYTPSESRPLPKWMAYLPSIRHSTLAGTRNPTALIELPSQVRASVTIMPETSSKNSFQTSREQAAPLKKPPAAAGPVTIAESPAPSRPGTTVPSRRPSAFPFFQNPRAPMSPATESSWGPTAGPSSGMIPYSGVSSSRSSSVRPLVEKTQDRSVPSKEYINKYAPKFPDSARKLEICPVCDRPVEITGPDREQHHALRKSNQDTGSADAVRGFSSKPYHAACMTCRSCHLQFQPSESVSDWTWMDSKKCYHKACINPEVKPMIERLKRKMSLRQVRTQQQQQQQRDVEVVTTPIKQGKGEMRSELPLLERLRSTAGVIDTPASPRHNSLAGFFSTGSSASSPRNSPRPPTRNEGQARTILHQDRCAVCGLAFMSRDYVIGSGDKKAHERCAGKKRPQGTLPDLDAFEGRRSKI